MTSSKSSSKPNRIIIGIDPGSRITGYGIVTFANQQCHHVASGVLNVGSGDLADRLYAISQGLSDIIDEYRPTEAALEDVFVHRNAGSALKLGQARGAAIVAVARQGLTLEGYTPRQIKQAVVGYGGADKPQVQHMIKILLNLTKPIKADAADALAVAICHAHMAESLKKIKENNNDWTTIR